MGLTTGGGFDLLPGEVVVTELHHGVAQRGLDLTAQNKLTLTNRRVVVRYATLLSESQEYVCELEKITAVAVRKTSATIPAIVTFFLVSVGGGVILALVGSQWSSFHAANMPHAAIWPGLLLSVLIYVFGGSIGVQMSIPGFGATNVSQGAPALLALLFPPLRLIIGGQQLRGDGLYFKMARGVNTEKLQEFANQVWEQKRLLGEGKQLGVRPAASAGLPPRMSSEKSVKERLRDIEGMRKEGLITEEECAAQRKRVLGNV